MFSEVEYLLRLANQRLQLERDVEGAAALLRTADARLEEANNPALVPVRRAIAEELAALKRPVQVGLKRRQVKIAPRPFAAGSTRVAFYGQD